MNHVAAPFLKSKAAPYHAAVARVLDNDLPQGFGPQNGRGGGAPRCLGPRQPCHVPSSLEHGEARAAWAKYVKATYGSREICAVETGCSFNTACNWFDEISTPHFAKVLGECRRDPERFVAFFGG